MSETKKNLKDLIKNYKNKPKPKTKAKSNETRKETSSDSKSRSKYKRELSKYMKETMNYEEVVTNEEKSISLLIIIIDELPTEYIWRDWLNYMDAQYKFRVKIYIHAKFPSRVRSSWVRDRLIRSNLKPEWGSVELSIAMMLLLKKAIHSSNNTDYYMFLSESCIPIYPINVFFDILDTHNNSWYITLDKANNGYSTEKQFEPLEPNIPKKCIIKTDQWVLLNKKNAYQVANFESDIGIFHSGLDFWDIFYNVTASDEMWISTLLCIVNYGVNQINHQRATYVVWENGEKSPETFRNITAELINDARGSGALFCRKIASNSRTKMTEQWHEAIEV